jgi:hypothetical protein
MSETEKKDLEALLEDVFKSTSADKNYSAIKALIGLAPGIGGGVAEFYSTYISSPSQKRLCNFLEKLIDEFQRLESLVSSFSIDSLQENPSFKTILVQALEIVKRNHQVEKLEVLRNLILNSVLQDSIEDDIKLLFLDWINELKVSHLHLLYVLYEPNKYIEKEIVLNKLESNKELYCYFMKQLLARELVSFDAFCKQADAIVEEENNYRFPLPAPLPYTRISSAGVPITRYSRYSEEKRMSLKIREREQTLRNINWAIQSIKNNKTENYTTELGNLFIQFIKSPLGDN